MIKNPRSGFRMPDDIDHEEILKISMPYIKPFVSKAVDWTPLKNLNTKFTKFDISRPNEEDVWQFTTFLVDHRERINAYERPAGRSAKQAVEATSYQAQV